MNIRKFIFVFVIIWTSTNTFSRNTVDLRPNQTITFKDSVLTVVLDGFKIDFKHSGELELKRKSKDTLFLFNFSDADLTSIIVSGKDNEWKIFQQYKTQLFIQFDGKAFEMNNWKCHLSPWIQIWFDSDGKNVKSYSDFDREYFPIFTIDELLEGIETNRFNFSDYWTDYMLQAFGKNDKDTSKEPYYSVVISESHFKLVRANGQTIYIVIEHAVGC